jgi:hypothetical protein
MRRMAVALLIAVSASQAQACGACDEDKVAATYDHATIQRAAARRQLVVFCEVKGSAYGADRLRRVAERTSGVDAASIRTSAQPSTLSFAVDPRKRSAQSAAAALQLGAPRGTLISIVRIVDESGFTTVRSGELAR